MTFCFDLKSKNLTSDRLCLNYHCEGCDVVSSAPYCDPDPEENIRIVFQLAKEFNCPVDFHLGFKEIFLALLSFVYVCIFCYFWYYLGGKNVLFWFTAAHQSFFIILFFYFFIYVFIYVLIYVFIYLCVYLRVYLFMCLFTCLLIYVFIYVFIYLCVYLCMYVCMYVSILYSFISLFLHIFCYFWCSSILSVPSAAERFVSIEKEISTRKSCVVLSPHNIRNNEIMK